MLKIASLSSQPIIDQNLFCSITRVYGKCFNLPPLAAKMYAYLLFDFQRVGFTFDDFVTVFSASKSSISTNLNLLISQDLVAEMTKLDERKRYFVANENFVKVRFQEIAGRLREEISIINALENLQPKLTGKMKLRSDIYKDILIKNVSNIEESLNKL